MIRSSECKNCIPLAMSTANRTACAVSTTIPPPEWSSSWREPRGIYWVMTISWGGALQQPNTGRMFWCEKIRNLGNSSLKSRDARALQSRTDKIFATISLFCQRPRHDSPDGEIASLRWSVKSWMLMPLKRDKVASFVRVLVDQLWSLNEILRNSWPVSTANLCRLKEKFENGRERMTNKSHFDLLLGESWLCLVQWSVSIFVSQRYESTVIEQFLCNFGVSPKASVMQRRISMLV